MARQIKFRAWNPVDMEMEFDIQNAYDSLGPYNHNRDSFKGYLDGSYEVMQYTGLKDKNGVEIYEGDILDDQFHCGQLFEVKWIDEKAKFAHKKIVESPDSFCIGKPDYALNYEDCLKCEIIGNIHESPELLD